METVALISINLLLVGLLAMLAFAFNKPQDDIAKIRQILEGLLEESPDSAHQRRVVADGLINLHPNIEHGEPIRLSDKLEQTNSIWEEDALEAEEQEAI